MSQPKITVVIPTRERCELIPHALRTVTTQDYDNLEILVSDNHSQDRTADAVRAIDDARIRYINPGKRLNMSHHWEFALSHVADGWVTILGDDDALMPGALRKVAAIIQESGVAAVRSEMCYYEWPDREEVPFGVLRVPMGYGWQLRNAKVSLAKVMNGRAGYRELPVIYNGGFVSTTVLRAIVARSGGAIFRSCQPDVYSGIAIASVVDRYAFSKEPFAVNGASRHSTGAAGFAPPEKAAKLVGEMFRFEGNIPFHPHVPMMPDGRYPASMEVFAYESYLQSTVVRATECEFLPAQQLEIILASSDSNGGQLDTWGKLFAERHHLDYDSVRRRADQQRHLRKLWSIPRRLEEMVQTVRFASADVPIRNVYEAALCAAAVRTARVRMVAELRGQGEAAMRKLLKL